MRLISGTAKENFEYHISEWLFILILDELHKMPMWKNYLKGVFDTKPEHMKILVTVEQKKGAVPEILSSEWWAHLVAIPYLSFSEACLLRNNASVLRTKEA